MVVMPSNNKDDFKSVIQYERGLYSSSDSSSEEDQDCSGGEQGQQEDRRENSKKDKNALQQPAVVWKDSLFSFLTSLHRNVVLSDLVIHCKEGKLPAHRVILASSGMLASLLQGEVADIYLPDFSTAAVLQALNFIYKGFVSAASETDLTSAEEVLKMLGFNNIVHIKPEVLKKKKMRPKVKLKVKHEKNLGSRKLPEVKPQTLRKKRVLMANLDPHELTCEVCHKSFPAIYKLKIHKLTHSDTFPFMCANCGKGFNNKYKMHAHEKKLSCKDPMASELLPTKVEPPPKPAKILPCEHCDMTFPLVRELKRHIQTVHKAKQPIVCIHCNTVCRSQKTLITHLKAVHNDFENGLKFSCAVCGKRFLKLSSLEDHQVRHDNVKHFACMYCPKRCAIKQDLDRHLRSHSGEASLVCQYCSREFVHRTTYISHVRRHMGERPYHCRPCGKQFGTLNILKKHQASHQRKGDLTRLVKASKGGGSRGGEAISYIEAAEEGVEEVAEEAREAAQVYIPAPPHYIKAGASITPLSQMQVVADFTEISRINYERPVENNQIREEEGLLPYAPPPRHRQLQRLEDEGDGDSRDDTFILGLFQGGQSITTQTTLDSL